MSEWSTYGLSDFLMFSPQAYWRLVARYNAAWWPAQGLALALSLALPVLLRSPSSAAMRAMLLLLALAWAWTGWAFQWQRYAEIFLGAPWLASASAAQALLLLVAALLPVGASRPVPAWLRAVGWGLIAITLAFPLLAPLRGRGWSEAEVFGFMPDPTALATLGVLLATTQLPAWRRIVLAVIPLASLLLGSATRWLLA